MAGVDKMNGLGMSILLEGEARGEARGENNGIALCAKIMKAIRSKMGDNVLIAEQCGCTEKKVGMIRNELGG